MKSFWLLLMQGGRLEGFSAETMGLLIAVRLAAARRLAKERPKKVQCAPAPLAMETVGVRRLGRRMPSKSDKLSSDESSDESF